MHHSLEKLDEFEQQYHSISKTPDEFNNYFAPSGWIAHESINHELMLRCISLAKQNQIEQAEEELADYYTSDNLKWLSHQLKHTEGFSKRYTLIRLAYDDTIQGKFYSAVPLLLMIIDGGVNDINKSKGFFTDTVGLTAWDSVAAHSSGLMRIRDIFNEMRKKTNENQIFLPYRNGILHGRDLNYSNKYVTGKCWATLIALNDWAKAIKNGKHNQPQQETEQPFTGSILELKQIANNYQEHKNKIAETYDYINRWSPRNINIGVDMPKNGEIDNYKDFTPEKDAIKFLVNWKNKNYGKIAEQIYFFQKNVNLGKEAGQVRKIFENRILKSFEIDKIIDCAPAISEVYLKVKLEYLQKEYELDIRMRMIYQDESGKSLVLGQENGKWKFIESFFFHKIEYPIFPN